MAGERILLVDDVKENLFSLETLLNPEGYIMDKALSGKEALKLILKNQYYLILLDVQMPEMNGFEVARFVKSNPRTKEIPIIFITAISKEDEFVNEGFSTGAFDYFTKPIKFSSLIVNKIRIFVDLYKQKIDLQKTTEELDRLNSFLANKADASEKKYATLFNKSNDANLLLSLDGEIKDVNLKAVKMLGFNKKEITGTNIKELFEKKEESLNKLMNILGTKDGYFQLTIINKHKNFFPAEISASMIDLEERQVIMVIIRDITQRVAYQNELEESKNRIEAIYKVTSSSESIELQFVNLMNLMTRQYNLETGLFSRMKGENFTIEFLCSPPNSGLKRYQIYPANNSLSEITQKSGKPFIIEDVKRSVFKEYKVAGKESPGAYLGIPVSVKGKVYGVLSFISPFGRKFSKVDQSLLLSVSQWMGNALERFHHEQEQTYIKDQLEAAQKIANMGNWEWDLKTNKMVWAGQLYKIFDVTPEHFKPSWNSFFKLIHSEDRKLFDNLVGNAIKNKNSFDIEYRIILPGGGQKWLHTWGVTEIANKNRLTKVYGVSQDISERRNTRNEIEVLNKELELRISELHNYHKDLENLVVERTSELKEAQLASENANLAKSDFLARMSHEIRTPMNAIIGLTYLLLELKLSEKQRSYISKIASASNALLVIINDILDYSKIEAGKLDIENIEFSIDKLFEDLSTVVSYQTREKGINLVFDIQPEVPVKLSGDALRINQILINLVINAIKFTERGEIVLKCQIIEENQEQIKLEFSVKDTGIGIRKEKIKEIFQSFSQENTSTTRTHGGTGLGLSISKKLTEMMGGKIWVNSKPEKGSVFHIVLTLDKMDKKEDQKSALSEDYSGNRALIFSPDSGIILKKYLDKLGMESSVIGSLKQVRDLLSNNEILYQYLFLDNEVFEKDGPTPLHLIEKDLIGKSMQLILMINSGQANLDEFKNIKVLDKPFTRGTVNNIITKQTGNNLNGANKKRDQDKNDKLKDLKGARILLVEDNEINQEIMVELLINAGLEVDVANNGKEGLMKASSTVYDSVLMDIQMPEMDGYEATTEIRKLFDNKELPIIAMTADAVSGVKDKCLKAGMDDFLVKPINVEEVFLVLKKWVKNRQVNQI